MDVAHLKPDLPVIILMEGDQKGQYQKDNDGSFSTHSPPLRESFVLFLYFYFYWCLGLGVNRNNRSLLEVFFRLY